MAAEVIAVSDAMDNLLTGQFFLHEIFGQEYQIYVLKDNVSAFWTLQGGSTMRMQYIIICASQVREAVETEKIELISIDGEYQLADWLTKPLGPQLFEQFCSWFYRSQLWNFACSPQLR